MVKIDFNIGDKVLCKKNYKVKNTNILFLKNKTYNIEKITHWNKENNITNVIMYNIINLVFRGKETPHEGWSFISTNEIHNLYLPNFEDYFYTKKEIRKIKLNKIDNERN